MFAGNFEPSGWAFCDGRLMPINDDTFALFELIGTTYGGDGQTTFALPDLRSRVPIHMGSGPGLSPRTIGEQGGAEAVTLTTQQIPTHTHAFLATGNTATGNSPANNAFAGATGATIFPYGTDQPLTTLNPQTIGSVGGSQPHDNFQPYLCVNYILALVGDFPSPT
jgi:microcystin-dependent protein